MSWLLSLILKMIHGRLYFVVCLSHLFILPCFLLEFLPSLSKKINQDVEEGRKRETKDTGVLAGTGCYRLPVGMLVPADIRLAILPQFPSYYLVLISPSY